MFTVRILFIALMLCAAAPAAAQTVFKTKPIPSNGVIAEEQPIYDTPPTSSKELTITITRDKPKEAPKEPPEEVITIAPSATTPISPTSSPMIDALKAGYTNTIKFHDVKALQSFYEARQFQPIWKKSGDVKNILNMFEDSWRHGLNPGRYHLATIREHKLNKDIRDLIISDAIILYGKDMSGMRVDPRQIGQKARYWRKPLGSLAILDYVTAQDRVKDALNNMAPRGALYQALQAELVRLYKTPAAKAHFKKINVTRTIYPGKRYPAIADVRARMGVRPDQAPLGIDYYDDELAATIMAFQSAHGLKPDGIIGNQTIGMLNITHADKINQVLANLERLRWVEQNKPARYIMVNVPSATLWAVQDNRVVMEMPVVVGRPERATNIFTTDVTGIRFNPTWTVPPTIKKDDYLPKLRHDAYYLSDRGIELKEGGQTIDPGSIDWKNKSWSEVNAMRMVQGPGSANPLGRVRFLMNNPFNIYLHDTPVKSYFARADRAQSSGCIRLEKPVELADFVLGPNDDYSTARRDKILKSGRLTEVYAAQPLPVYILYQTVWLGDRGQIIYGADIYGHDKELINALNEIGGIATPVGI